MLKTLKLKNLNKKDLFFSNKVPHTLLRHALNIWGPFRGAGIRVQRISPDFRHIVVKMSFGILNANINGSQFGGSLFAMTDPFYSIMLMKALGPEFIVWDKSASIEFKKPGRGPVEAQFSLDQATIDSVHESMAKSKRSEPTFSVKITDSAGDTIALVHKTLSVKQHSQKK